MTWWHCICFCSCFSSEEKEPSFKYRKFSQHAYEERLPHQNVTYEKPAHVINPGVIMEWQKKVLKESPKKVSDFESAFPEEILSAYDEDDDDAQDALTHQINSDRFFSPMSVGAYPYHFAAAALLGQVVHNKKNN